MIIIGQDYYPAYIVLLKQKVMKNVKWIAIAMLALIAACTGSSKITSSWKAKDFQAVFVTLDPARDKTQVMKDYMKSFDARILGLRGGPDDIEATAKSFHVYYRPRALGNGQYTVDHSSYIYVMDPKGKFTELLTGDLPGHPLVDDLRKLDK